MFAISYLPIMPFNLHKPSFPVVFNNFYRNGANDSNTILHNRDYSHRQTMNTFYYCGITSCISFYNVIHIKILSIYCQ